jgi:hypothetical protein
MEENTEMHTAASAADDAHQHDRVWHYLAIIIATSNATRALTHTKQKKRIRRKSEKY